MKVDPRVQARRIAVMRARGRRRLRILIVFGIILLTVAAAFGVTLTPLLDVDEIAISGVSPVRESIIAHSSEIEVDEPLLYVDTRRAQDQIAEIPWVRSVQINRDWPSAVQIEVVPRVPVAVVPGSHGRLGQIDSNAYVIGWLPAGAATASDRLPHISVPFEGNLGGIHTSADGPIAVVLAMPTDLRHWVRTVTLDPTSGDVGLELYGGAIVHLGQPTLLSDKVSALRALLAGTDLRCAAAIDVAMADIPTLRRHPFC